MSERDPESDRDLQIADDDLELGDLRRTDVIVAGIVGAALGAGLGLLALRAWEEERPAVVRGARRVRRRAERALRDVPAPAELTGAVRDVVADARAAAEEAVERELRALRRAVRRRRRQLGL